MQEKEFEQLIDQYLENRLSVEQKSRVELWLRQMANDTAFDRLAEQERVVIKDNVYKKILYKINFTNRTPALSKIVLIKPLFKLAASILLFGIFLYLTPLKEAFTKGSYISVNSSNNTVIKNILPDGTIIWLKGNSKLSYPRKFIGNTRSILLNGEALFEVAKDAAHPFIIHSGTLTTTVLGTSFNIKQDNNKIEVNVLTGRVFLSSKNAAPIVLHPRQKAVYDELKKQLNKATQPVLQIASLIAGTEYNMSFNETRVANVLRQVEKKFDVSIIVKNQQVNNELITVDITDKSLIKTLDIISEALNLDYKKNEQEVVLTDKILIK